MGDTANTEALSKLILERCANTIEKAIVPNVTGAFAVAQATCIVKILRTLAPVIEMNNQVLIDENDAMKGVLVKVIETLRGEKALSQDKVSKALVEKLDQELKKNDISGHEENIKLKGALVETIEGLDVLINDIPKETMSSLKDQIRIVLRQQLNNELAHTTFPV